MPQISPYSWVFCSIFFFGLLCAVVCGLWWEQPYKFVLPKGKPPRGHQWSWY